MIAPRRVPKLTKIIPARRVTENFMWVRREWMTFGQYRNARETHKMSVDRRCFWCKKKFEDGDQIALAGRRRGNKLLCVECAEESFEEEA